MKVDAGNMIDHLILNYPPGSVLVPICAKEVLVLRTLGMRWQRLTTTVAKEHESQMKHPTGFGPVTVQLYVSRKYTQDNVIGNQLTEIAIPEEFFEWPLQK